MSILPRTNGLFGVRSRDGTPLGAEGKSRTQSPLTKVVLKKKDTKKYKTIYEFYQKVNYWKK